MAFVEVLNLLFEKAKEKHGIKSQKEFADRHGISREHMNQFMTGSLTPPAKAIWQILKVEGYELNNCVYLPDLADNLSKKHQVVTKQLHEILEQEGSEMPPLVITAIEAWHQQILKKKRAGKRRQ